MLKLKDMLVPKFLFIVIGIFLLFSSVIYFSLNSHLEGVLESIPDNNSSLLVQGLYNDFYSLWILLSLVFILLFLLSFLIFKKSINNLLFDVKQLNRYVENISNKNYSEKIKIKHYSEFLQISIMLKNLVKRLNSRDKKIPKKSSKK